MRKIGRLGGRASAARRLDKMDVMRRRLIAVNAARARWGRPKWSDAEESAFLQGWVAGIEYRSCWARVSCRLHDLRHTFATPLAENGASESTMLALMGQMSGVMLERYSHIRMTAKRDAVAGITLRQKGENSEVVPVKVPVVRQPARVQ